MRALVFAGGDPPDERALAAALGSGDPALVVAADSGVAHALAHHLPVDLVVGDLDSAAPDHLAVAEGTGARVERHPVDKDMTDLELALRASQDLGATAITLLGGGGGRLDHLLANLLLLAHDDLRGVEMDAFVGRSHVTVVRGTRTLTGVPGGIVTLLPVGGRAEGVTTIGLRWTLTDDVLTAASTRGVSNELVAPSATVSVQAGVLLAVQSPGDQ